MFDRLTRGAAPGGMNASPLDPSALRRLYPEALARQFAVFSRLMDEHVGRCVVSRAHVDAAYGLLHRRVEVMPRRIDRVIAAGMAALVLVRLGSRVHLVVDGQWSIDHVRRWLLPVLDRAGIAAGVVDAGSDERTRARAWRQPMTVAAARECAMDFLRDAYNWPERGDPSVRLVDRLLGAAARQRATLMQGLPCAILLDIDSALVDNARTPVVLTRDAHPMHESEALEKALAMVAHLERGVHFTLTGAGEEVALTAAGEARLADWSRQLGGIWSVAPAARQLLCVAVVVEHVLVRGVHYGIEDGAVRWLVAEALVPGLRHYSAAFLSRMLETREGLQASGQREIVGRASYQQVFNRYVHLCGLAHSVAGIGRELRAVYGLRCGGRGRGSRRCAFDVAELLDDTGAVDAWLEARLGDRTWPGCRIVVANSAQRVEEIAALAARSGVEPHVIDQLPAVGVEELIAPGRLLVVAAGAMDCRPPAAGRMASCTLEIIVVQRSVRHSEDRRNLDWITASGFERPRRILVMSRDDELFEGAPPWALSRLARIMGTRVNATVLEWRIRRLQARRARGFSRIRRELLNYDTSMQGLLSISGRGLYE